MHILASLPLRSAAVAAALAASGCATAHAWVPGTAELSEALFARCRETPPELRDVRCRGFEEEPTEFHCTFEARGPQGNWARSDAVIAVDGSHWIPLDRTDHCLPASTRID